MELALALGMTLTDMLERMPASELALWRQKWSAAPWGDRREDERHAMRLHAFTAANTRRESKFKRSDFYPYKKASGTAQADLARELSKAGNIVVKGSSK